MPTTVDSTMIGRVRWMRFAAIMVPAAVAVGVLGTATARGAIGSSFAVSGSNFKVSVVSLDGQGFEQFGGTDYQVDHLGHPIQVSAIRSAEIRDMCQSMVIPSPIGKVSVILRAGGPGSAPVYADHLVMDVSSLSADATFTNIHIGQDASTVTTVPGTKGSVGGFAQQADHIHLSNVKQTAWATTAGTFKLNGLKLSLRLGDHECF